jgi:hypothetical protein
MASPSARPTKIKARAKSSGFSLMAPMAAEPTAATATPAPKTPRPAAMAAAM